jgi:hypothetical protein
MKTNCCHSTMHTTCIENFRIVLSLLSFEPTLEYGQATRCGCLWLKL